MKRVMRIVLTSLSSCMAAGGLEPPALWEFRGLPPGAARK
jgi:hypothetical protein